MNRYSEIMFRKLKGIRLDFLDHTGFTSFETATDPVIQQFYIELDDHKKRAAILEQEIAENYKTLLTYETEEQQYRIHEQVYIEQQVEYINACLDAVFEMKILYLFKNLELSIKNLISIAYPQTNVASFHKWENMKSFLKTKDIHIPDIAGYQECMELKKVNNCIKHTTTLGDDIQSINEFKNEDYFRHDSLAKFYTRIKGEIKPFCIALKEKIKSDIYTFPSERLSGIANEYYERMNDETLALFINKLQEKLDGQNYHKDE